MIGRESSSRVVAETTEVRSRVRQLQEKSWELARDGTLYKAAEGTGRCRVLPVHTVTGGMTISSEKNCGENGVVVESLCLDIHVRASSEPSFESVKTVEDLFDSVFVLGQDL